MKQISANPTNWAFFHPDQVGSVSLITNGQGLLIAQISHRPFGGIDQAHSVGSPEALKNWASYTGQEMDPETGLIYYQFRYYDPSLRRFLSPDNSTPKGPSVSQTYNRYAYVQNNPINFNDPTGHKGCHWYDLYCRGKVAVNDTIDTVKKVGNNAAEAVKTNIAYAKNTPLVRSLDHRRAEVTHILGLDNFSLSLGSSGDGKGNYCWDNGTCAESISSGLSDKQNKHLHDFWSKPENRKMVWSMVAAGAGAAATGACLGATGLSLCFAAGGAVQGFIQGYSSAYIDGDRGVDAFRRGAAGAAAGAMEGFVMAGIFSIGAPNWLLVSANAGLYAGAYANIVEHKSFEDSTEEARNGFILGLFGYWFGVSNGYKKNG